MGVERAVTLWYVQRQLILDAAAQVKVQLAQAEALLPTDEAQPDRAVQERMAELSLELARTRAKLQALGPCPKPTMG